MKALKRVACFILAAMLLPGLLLTGCQKDVPTAKVPELLVPSTLEAGTELVMRGDLFNTVILPVRALPKTEELYYPIGGIVETIHVKVGQMVEEGDVLISLSQEALLKSIEQQEEYISSVELQHRAQEGSLYYDLLAAMERNEQASKVLTKAQEDLEKLEKEYEEYLNEHGDENDSKGMLPERTAGEDALHKGAGTSGLKEETPSGEETDSGEPDGSSGSGESSGEAGESSPEPGSSSEPEDTSSEPDSSSESEDTSSKPDSSGEPEDTSSEPDSSSESEDTSSKPDSSSENADTSSEPDSSSEPEDSSSESDSSDESSLKPDSEDSDGKADEPMDYEQALEKQRELVKSAEYGAKFGDIAVRKAQTEYYELVESNALEEARLYRQLKDLQDQLDNNKLTAPFAGRVVDINYNEGQWVDEFATVVILASEDQIYLVSEPYNNASITAAIKIDVVLDGTVYDAWYEAYDEQEYTRRTMRGETLKAYFTTEDNACTFGQDGMIRLYYGISLNTLYVPKSCVMSDKYGSFVYKDVDGAREKTYITVGISTTSFIEVVSGLEEGDVIYEND